MHSGSSTAIYRVSMGASRILNAPRLNIVRPKCYGIGISDDRGKTDMAQMKKPTAGHCCQCQQPLEGDDIFHWSPASWCIWCFKCYKAEHYPNLNRINEENK